jgi:hypothetical protein
MIGFCLTKTDQVIEEHYHRYPHHPHGNINNSSNNKDNNNVKQLKQEPADLLEEDDKADKLRRLPLYSCGITGWKFLCSKCYDNVYNMLNNMRNFNSN